MSHLAVAPIMIPAVAGMAIVLLAQRDIPRQRVLSGLAIALQVAVAFLLLAGSAAGDITVYSLGAWAAPFGIVVVVDRLSALMVLLTTVLAAASWLYAISGPDSRGPNYHALFQFQLMGICGAFLTGDAFNLFVFFEVLLIASYGLLLHGGGRARIRAGLHYVVFNLVGSALFLIGVGTIYGVTGTLNMADIARKVPLVGTDETAILASGALVLMVVFAIKAALLPLYFWLPSAYASATAPVAALFAIMTKVGVYAILRFYTLAFGAEAGPLANLAQPWILPLALLTLLLGTIGALAGRRLGGLVAYLVIASVGTMLAAIGLGTAESLAAAVYYMIHSTIVLAAMFLVVDLISRQRGDTGSRLVRAAPVRQPALLGTIFVVLAVAASGLPPLSGFIGKVLILRGALDTPEASWVFAAVLVSGFLTLVAVSRAGSMLFWNVDREQEAPSVSPARGLRLAAVAVLLALLLGLSVFAGRAVQFSSSIAQQLLEPSGYVEAVLDAAPPARGHEPEIHAAGGGR